MSASGRRRSGARAAPSSSPPGGRRGRSPSWSCRSSSSAGWFYWQLHPPGGAGDPVSVEIAAGLGRPRRPVTRSRPKGVVGSSLAFQIWEKVSGGGSFQAGTYQLRESMGVSDASDALASGPSTAAAGAGHTVLALPPGLRLEQIADRVGALPGHDRAAFLALAQSGQIRSKYQGDQQSVEGFTWPDTYFVEGHDRRADPADHRVGVRRARRRGEPRRHRGDRAHAAADRGASRRWCRPKRAPPPTRPRSRP